MVANTGDRNIGLAYLSGKVTKKKAEILLIVVIFDIIF